MDRVVRAGAVILAAIGALAPSPVRAHGGVTGLDDVWQDYGLAIFLALVVVVGAGVLVWVMLAPLPTGETGDAPDTTDARGGSDLHEAGRVHDEHGRAP